MTVGRGRRRLGAYVLAFLLYQVAALLVWWHLLAAGLGRSLPTGSGDPGEEVWFLAWLPHALGSGVNPFFSRAIFAPAGVNLLSNTSMELLGLVFAPVTVLWGPVATFSVASLLAPSTSALGAFALCRRHVRWAPAAFLGGLVYGFGPFVGTDLRFGHLDLTWLAIPPLVILGLERLLAPRPEAGPASGSPPRSKAAAGAAVGLLLVAQFFVSTEFLAITVITAAVGGGLWLAASPRQAASRLRDALPGLALAVGVPAVVLAYPAWYAVVGPRHIVGPVWPDIDRLSATLAAAVLPHAELRGIGFISGGNGSYLGIGMLVVLLAGAIRYRSDGRLRAALVMTVVSYVASLGYSLRAGSTDLHVPLPASVLAHLPLLDSVIPERFSAMTDLFAGIALAVVCDLAREDGFVRLRARSGHIRASHASGVVAAVVLAAAAVVPLAFEPSWPYPVRSIEVPAALRPAPEGVRSTVSGLTAVFPGSANASSDQMVFQAMGGFRFTLPSGYAIVPGPGGHGTQEPPMTPFSLVSAAVTLHRLVLPLPASTDAALRSQLSIGRYRGVLVLPGAGSAIMGRAITEVLGPPTSRLGGAEIWSFSRQ